MAAAPQAAAFRKLKAAEDFDTGLPHAVVADTKNHKTERCKEPQEPPNYSQKPHLPAAGVDDDEADVAAAAAAVVVVAAATFASNARNTFDKKEPADAVAAVAAEHSQLRPLQLAFQAWAFPSASPLASPLASESRQRLAP